MGSGVGMGFCEKFLGPWGEIKTNASLAVRYIIEVCTAGYSSLIKKSADQFWQSDSFQVATLDSQSANRKTQKRENRGQGGNSPLEIWVWTALANYNFIVC